jgi:hypothetical protein
VEARFHGEIERLYEEQQTAPPRAAIGAGARS